MSDSDPFPTVSKLASEIGAVWPGYELAKQFAKNGFDLLVTSTGERIDTVAEAFEQLGAKVETVQADLATYDGVEALYQQIQAGQYNRAVAQVPPTLSVALGQNLLGHPHSRICCLNDVAMYFRNF